MHQNYISIIILSLCGFAIILYALLKILRKTKAEPPYEPSRDDPLIHIEKRLFLEIPIEKITITYFTATTVIYIIKLIAGVSVAGIDLTVLYLSGTIFLLLFYKILMGLSIRKFSPWLLFSLIFSILILIIVITGQEPNIVPLLASTLKYNRMVHLLGLVLGLGGTLMVDIMFTHFLRNYKITSRESVIMHLISQMIILGIILLILSGIALFLPFSNHYLDSPRFLMKMTVVLIIIINGGALNLYVTPLMKKISLKKEEKGKHETLKRVSFALGAISIVSWLAAFLLAMLKTSLELPYPTLFVSYLILLAIAIAGSQMAKSYYEKKEAGVNK